MLGAVTPGFIRWKNGLTAICTAVIYAATDEIHQLFVSGRSGRITDVLIDGCGAVAGTLIILLISRIIVMCRKRKLTYNISCFFVCKSIILNDLYLIQYGRYI